jgi:hypothetical protein
MSQDDNGNGAPVTITVNAKCQWSVTPETVELSKSGDDKNTFKKVDWTINGVANDVIVIIIEKEGCFQKNNPNDKRIVYREVLDDQGKGTIKSKNLRGDVTAPSEWKYAIVRVSNDAKEYCFEDPQISVRG